jgi:hypothetical protein
MSSRFYGTLQGGRGAAKTATDPQHVTINGWDSGVMVVPTYLGTRKDNIDAFEVYATSGSHATANPVKIGTVYQGENGPVFVPEDAVTVEGE